MSVLSKKIVLGVTGGIAIYKSPALVRRLIDHGAEVQVVMTSGACEFVKPLVFQAVSGNEVHTQLLDDKAEAGMGHIELARWADIVLIAPCTANSLAKITTGMADDLLSTVCLATTAPLVIAPAMNSVMWDAAATTANIETLKQRGVKLLGPGIGSQACGETGAGRMLEPDDIVDHLQALDLPSADSKIHNKFVTSDPANAEIASSDLSGADLKHVDVLITAGPTRERIDPVRFLSNHSSGKMGYALAEAAKASGANVTLVSGPVTLATPAGVNRVDVMTAEEMQTAVMSRIKHDSIFISVAAVADYRVADQSDEKIKKTDEELTLTLVRNPDILAGVASSASRPFCVGFAAETQKLEHYARSKLAKKNLDMIVANLVSGGRTFGKDKNEVEVFWAGGGSKSFALQSKRSLANGLIDLIAERYKQAL